MLRIAFCLVAIWLLSPSVAHGLDATGRVFLDNDGDGRRDWREAGVAGVKMSNGRDVVLTDAQGRYRLALRDGDTIFAIKPATHRFPLRANGLPAFWRHHFPRGSRDVRYGGIGKMRANRFDIALLPAPDAERDDLDVLVFGDPQPKTATQAGYYEQDIIESVLAAAPSDRAAADLGVSLGDIVDDDLSLYPQMNRATARLGVPWLHVPGNHDIDFDVSEDAASTLTFRNTFGPDTYAWEERGTTFIVLDDVVYQPGQSPAYIGGLRADQFDFLEHYLATLDAQTRLVIAIHIPLFDAPGAGETFRHADRARLFALLQRFREPLILSAHSHAQRHVFHDAAAGWNGAVPLHEYNVGTTCGGYWSGLPDARGIPDARMVDGTPNGYARLGVDADGYRLRWFATGEGEQQHMTLHAPRALRAGSYPAFAVHANVWMGLDDSRVEYRIDGGAWQPMLRVAAPDPALVALNVRDDMAEHLLSFDRSVQAEVSPHLWRGVLPTNLGIGEHRIDVRAFDRWIGEVSASTMYRLESPPDA